MTTLELVAALAWTRESGPILAEIATRWAKRRNRVKLHLPYEANDEACRLCAAGRP